jgi:hypothetical protein
MISVPETWRATKVPARTHSLLDARMPDSSTGLLPWNVRRRLQGPDSEAAVSTAVVPPGELPPGSSG